MRREDILDWVHRLKAELRRDRRKAFLLALLALVACGMGLRLLSRGKTPASAKASATALAAPIRQAAPAPVARDAGQDFLQELRRDKTKLARDLFAPNPEFFPRPKPKPKAKVKIEPAGQAAPKPTPAARQVDPTLQRRAIEAQASTLHLQSTMLGTRPTAIVNNLVLRRGDWIHDFQVIAITERTCVLRKEGVSVVLEMKR